MVYGESGYHINHINTHLCIFDFLLVLRII